MFAVAKDEVQSRTERLEAELAAARSLIKQLESRIETDVLLDIANRRGFERELARAVLHVHRYQRSAAVIFIDLDNFKSINDRFGHLAGDAALKAVSDVIIKTCRRSDTVARYGGDEFAVLLWNLGESAARAKALAFEKIIEAMEIRFTSDVCAVGAPTGVTMLQRFDSLPHVIARADKDMYSRKMEKKSEEQPRPTSSDVAARHIVRLSEDMRPRGAELDPLAR